MEKEGTEIEELDVEEGQSILLLGDPFETTTQDICNHLLLSRADDSKRKVIKVSFHTQSDKLVENWSEQGQLPDEGAIIEISSLEDSGGRSGGSTEYPIPMNVRYVNRNDLTGIGIGISESLGAFEDRNVKIAVCFDNLTSAMMNSDGDLVYRFVNTITSRIIQAGATVHYHLDPGAHDSQTVSMLQSSVQMTVEALPDGDAEVRRRW
ncbi:MAG: hypothetical protein SV760_01735 [Halobacteria archaeon]|nr:hypothetical protein [Halobacteria archaeon]